jgi:hypothetical protein
MQPSILPIQILRIGQLVILSVPGGKITLLYLPLVEYYLSIIHVGMRMELGDENSAHIRC